MPVIQGIVVVAENENVIVEVCVTVVPFPPIVTDVTSFGGDLGVPRSGTRCGRESPCKAVRAGV